MLILTPALLAAEEPAAVSRKKLSAISLLPDGSQLHGVMFPRYDENHGLTGVLQAKAMTLVNEDTISGESVAIEFFNPDRSPRARVDLTRAVFNQTTGLLEAKESVIMHGDRLSALGTGLYYAFEHGKGFLFGPVTTWIENPTATTMNSNPSPIRSTALIGISLLTLPLNATPPPAVTAGELAAIHADAASTAATAKQATASARSDLAKDASDAAAASTAANNFITQAGISTPDAEPPVAEIKPLDLKPGPEDTVITCDGGMYFDADEGVMVYLKNVRVTDPRFNLTGANEMKIFLGKKPATGKPATGKSVTGKSATDKSADSPEKTAKKDPLGSGPGAKFDDVERIVASGAVRILQKATEAGKEPVEASGAICTYHPKTGQIILSGGYPWVKQGATFMRAEQPNLNLRILKTGSFVTEGKWVMGGPLNRK